MNIEKTKLSVYNRWGIDEKDLKDSVRKEHRDEE